jgi:dolichol-phosphate mannosyltransferase
MRGILERRHLRELAVYSLIGASGYVVNLAVFQLVYGAGASHLVAATAAFLVAVTNNFLLNRRWTFPGATEGAKRVQAPRFLTVSLLAFGVSLGVLEVLVSVAGLPAILAQASAVLIVTPIGFVGQKLWSFRRPRVLAAPAPVES